MKKRGKKVSLNLSQKHSKKYNLTFGTINNTEPNTVYIITSSWVTPKDDEVSYESLIRRLKKSIKTSLYRHIISEHQDLFDARRVIVDLDIRSSGVRLGKQSYMNCEVTLFNINKLPIQDDKMNRALQRISRFLMYQIFDKDGIFRYSSIKKS